MRVWARALRLGVVVVVMVAAALSTWGAPAEAGAKPVAVLLGSANAPGIDKIKHVVVLMQENRSFDEYFGKYPGADGIPVDADGNPTVCAPDPKRGVCSAPFHDPHDANFGGPHSVSSTATDIDQGAMDGFINAYEIQCKVEGGGGRLCGDQDAPVPDVMGYKLRADIPNYWAYADNFVLQDHMFEPLSGPSLRSHLTLVSGWSAICDVPHVVSSCLNDESKTPSSQPDYAWTDVTYLLKQAGVSWNYFVFNGTEPDCIDPNALVCVPRPLDAKTGGYWNPLPKFDTVRADKQLPNIQSVTNFVTDARSGTLPSVSWVVPTSSVSEHPSATVSDGQKYITYLMNSVMQGPDWDSTAIFLAWDDWGGFYDHVQPPAVDGNGYGLRVPGLMVSAYAKAGYIDHQTLSFDAYLRFIEDRFLGGARIDPATDGRPDNRPDVRENAPQLGDLRNDFDFTQDPRPPLVLPTVAASKLATPLVVPKHAPKATARQIEAADAAPVIGDAPLAVTFDASQTAGAGARASWTLDFGDGSELASGSGRPSAPIEHTYTDPGDYTATLSVSNTNGKASTATLGVDVTLPKTSPTTWITGTPINGDVGKTIHFDASHSTSGDWSVDFGDGSDAVVGSGVPPANLTHVFAEPGVYHSTLTVVAPDSGVTKATATTSITAGGPPRVGTGNASAVTGTTAKLAGRVNPNGAPSASFWFDWGPTRRLGMETAPVDTTTTGNFDADLSGLLPHHSYFFRIAASSAFGTSYGKIIKFTTSPS
ncbi:MAG TPA: alkaline phosphatase family protein [Acidimicrobiia bacterium]|jgi:phospholipase C|nr:alkaline phosphatase family protein [Acidimicrobiia bacterium]